MKISIKIFSIFVAGVALSSIISTYAATALNSNDIMYCPETNNMQAATVADAIDLLYERVDNVPIGTIMSYMGLNAPSNYLICDGSIYNIADYPKLAEHIKNDFNRYDYFGGDGNTTFAVPDLRGEFLRGAGTNSHTGNGNGANLGDHQDATQIGKQYLNSSGNTAYFGLNNESDNFNNYDSQVNSERGREYFSNPAIDSYNIKQSYTARPTNTSVNYLIKAN